MGKLLHKSIVESRELLVGNGQAPTPRLRISKPRTCCGTYDAKEVENFLFDIEQYFLTSNIEDGARLVTTATMPAVITRLIPEDEDVVGVFSHRYSTISHRVIKKSDVSQKNIEKEEPKPRVCKAKGLMYINVKINRKLIKVMVDTGATHNYLASSELECIGLVLEKGNGKVKAINLVAQPIVEVAKSTLIKVGPFEGRTNLSAVQMDDFKLILGLKFIQETKTAVLLFFYSLMIMVSKSCIISMLVGKIEKIEEVTDPISNPVRRLLQEFEDVMPDELPKRLLPMRTIDHKIKLILGAKLPTRAPYRMAQSEVEELRKQLAEILDSGISMPTKSPYRAPVLFQKKGLMIFFECAVTIEP
ncbi:Uncharacterized protein Adt_08634 [Abeliophyllum distichum]|uniref:Uncharacterized protein n=1 Tax=Abeliophyllum distichum TaxID=126358 RepID=A0ABD1UG78_9LAMI